MLASSLYTTPVKAFLCVSHFSTKVPYFSCRCGSRQAILSKLTTAHILRRFSSFNKKSMPRKYAFSPTNVRTLPRARCVLSFVATNSILVPANTSTTFTPIFCNESNSSTSRCRSCLSLLAPNSGAYHIDTALYDTPLCVSVLYSRPSCKRIIPLAYCTLSSDTNRSKMYTHLFICPTFC